MIEHMLPVHLTDAELARNLDAVLEQVRNGAEVIIEQGHEAVAILKQMQSPGRSIDECIAIALKPGSQVTLDEDFAKDREDIIAERSPLDVPAWE